MLSNERTEGTDARSLGASQLAPSAVTDAVFFSSSTSLLPPLINHQLQQLSATETSFILSL